MNDPIIDKIHRWREEHARKFNYDISAMFEDIRRREKEIHDREIVDLSSTPKRDLATRQRSTGS